MYLFSWTSIYRLSQNHIFRHKATKKNLLSFKKTIKYWQVSAEYLKSYTKFADIWPFIIRQSILCLSLEKVDSQSQ